MTKINGKNLIIRNARVIDPATSTDEIRDVGVENGLFADPAKLGKDAQVIDLTGYVLAPGFTDMHVHLRQPGNTNAETIHTGALAADVVRYLAAAIHLPIVEFDRAKDLLANGIGDLVDLRVREQEKKGRRTKSRRVEGTAYPSA